MKVETVDFLTIPTRDTARAVAFYRDVLGFASSEYSDSEVESPNVTISFWNPARDGEEFRPHVGGFAVRVADVAETRRELEANGVEFIGETVDTGVCHIGFFKDPDGNTIILHRRYKPRGQS